MNIIKCPVCGKKSEKKDKTYICVNNHSFDIAKQGYTNFLLNNDKKSKVPGDTKEMLNDHESLEVTININIKVLN